MLDHYNCKMSGSEDERESHRQSGMTKAELRRSNKPIMEKRRRARINQCLDELKTLILEALNKDPARHSKLEKADILEMTVKYLQGLYSENMSTAAATDPTVLTKFRSGYSECATEVSQFMDYIGNVDPVVKQRLVSHLNNCVSNLQQITPYYGHYVPYMPERLYPDVKVGFQADFQNGDENNNGSARIQIPNGVQLIPSRLPTGELALLVPSSAAISTFPFFRRTVAESVSKVGHPSAFNTVQRPQSPLSPSVSTTSSYGEESHHAEHYPQSQSPYHQQRRSKITEQGTASNKIFTTSSPETQKPQISSSSDRNSPVALFIEPKSDSVHYARKESADTSESIYKNGMAIQNLRQPLAVITDKTYNQASTFVPRRESMKRCNSDDLLANPEKRARYQEQISSANSVRFAELPVPAQDLSNRNRNSKNSFEFVAAAGPSGANGDMWRPW